MSMWREHSGLSRNSNRPGSRRLSTALLMASTVVSLVSMSAMGPAHAQTGQASGDVQQSRSFEIAPQPLSSAINKFISQTGWQISYSSELVRGKQSQGVSGPLTPAAALQRLVAGTGLAIRIGAPGSAALVDPARSAINSSAADGTLLLDTITIAAGAGASGLTEGSNSYTTSEAGMLKGIESLRETPQSVSVITRKQIEDQNLTSLSDVLSKTNGLTLQRASSSAGSSLGNDTNFYSRGFQVGNIRIDGGAAMDTVLNGFGSISGIDMAQYDHVEFLRGIDGLYSSTGDPGGTVNLVRKRAKAEKQTTFSTSAGSWNNYRVEADTTGALNEDGTIRGRVGVAYQDQKYFYETAKMRNGLVHGSLEFDLTPDTLLILGGSYKKTDGKPDFAGLPRYSNGADLGLSRKTSLIPDWSYTHDTSTELYTRLEHNFNENWAVNANVLYSRMKRDHSGAYVFGGVDAATGAGGYLYSFPETNVMNRIAADINIKGNVEAFGQEHTLLFGTDYQRGKADSEQYTGYLGYPMDVFNPVFPDENLPASPLKDSYYTTEKQSFYGMARFGIVDGLQLIAGGRLSNYSYKSESWETNGTGYVQGLRHLKEKNVFTPYVGLTYDVTDNWTAYGSYAETYKPQYMYRARPLPGTPLDAVEAKNYELGIKGEILGGLANASFALYRIEQTGAAVENPDYPLSYGAFICCYLNQGKVVSEGFEAEISGEVLSGLQLSAGYTYNQNSDKDQNRSYSTITPKHMFKLWSTYKLPGKLEGLTLGGGVVAQSKTFVRGSAVTYNPDSGKWDGASVPFEFTQSGYSVWSTRIDYEIRPDLNIALNVNNIFDKKYYSTVGSSSTGNFYGEPRSFTVSLSGKF